MKYKHLEIETDLHDCIRLYCFVKNLRVRDFINNRLRGLPELVVFEKERKMFKFS